MQNFHMIWSCENSTAEDPFPHEHDLWRIDKMIQRETAFCITKKKKKQGGLITKPAESSTSRVICDMSDALGRIRS